jgi:hypothetical protein
VIGVLGSPGVVAGPSGTAKVSKDIWNCRVGPDGWVYMGAGGVCKLFKGNPATGEIQVVAEDTLGRCNWIVVAALNNTLVDPRAFTTVGMMPNGNVLYNPEGVSCLG